MCSTTVPSSRRPRAAHFLLCLPVTCFGPFCMCICICISAALFCGVWCQARTDASTPDACCHPILYANPQEFISAVPHMHNCCTPCCVRPPRMQLPLPSAAPTAPVVPCRHARSNRLSTLRSRHNSGASFCSRRPFSPSSNTGVEEGAGVGAVQVGAVQVGGAEAAAQVGAGAGAGPGARVPEAKRSPARSEPTTLLQPQPAGSDPGTPPQPTYFVVGSASKGTRVGGVWRR